MKATSNPLNDSFRDQYLQKRHSEAVLPRVMPRVVLPSLWQHLKLRLSANSSKRSVLKRLFGLLIGLVMGILMSCVQAPLAPLRIGTNVWPGYEPLYLAREQGYYGDTPIKFLESNSIAEHTRMFLNGNLEMLTTTLDTAFELASTEPDTRVYALLDVSNGADALIAQPQIESLKDLKGKRIGVQNATLGKLILTRALEAAGLSESEVQIVSLDVPAQEAAFRQKQVDALITFEPTRSQLLAAGANSLFDSSQMIGEIVDVLVGRAGLVNSHAKQVQMLLQGWYRALDYVQQAPDAATKQMAAREKVTPEQFANSFQGLRLVTLAENQQFFQQKSPFFDGMTRLAQFLREKQLVTTVVEPISLLEAEPIQQLNR